MGFVNQGLQDMPTLGADGTAGGLAALTASHPDADTVRVWKLRTSLLPFERLSSLRHLEIDDPLTLDGLDHLTQLSSLSIYSFPRVHSLDTLGALIELRRLHLSTPPSYDASRKVHQVDSAEAGAAGTVATGAEGAGSIRVNLPLPLVMTPSVDPIVALSPRRLGC